MRIALAQINTTVGAFEQNAARIKDYTERAKARGAQLVLFPELGLVGYPPKDFLELPEFVHQAERALEDLSRPAAWNRGISVYLGAIERHEGPGAGLYNAAALLVDGQRRIMARKTLLPTYDVFDEGRYFDPGPEVTLAEVAGTKAGLSICEDIWNDKAFWRKRRYTRDPIEEMAAKGARLILNISASPYAQGKPRLREEMLGAAARHHRVPIAYLNLVGGNDSLVFDGHSTVFDEQGAVIARAKGFVEDLVVVDLPGGGGLVAPLAADLDELTEALIVGTRDYAQKTGFKGAVLGLSGGIDSCLTAFIAARAFPPDEVMGVAMPSRYTAQMSNADAELLAGNLGIRFTTLPIEPVFEAFLKALRPVFGDAPPDVTEENIQARVRGTLLMALSNKHNKLLLTTGNKSELSVGYCTLYGDMAGGLAVIGDLPKMTVFSLSKNANRSREIIPERSILRPPSAELRENQKDEDSLPPYPVLDSLLKAYVEERKESPELAAMGFPPDTVKRVLSLVLRSEYKRRQAAPTLRVSPKAFGEGWRFPIAHRFGY
ncbi:MAG: NAD+ synthase [Deltaproteobacteria bacterium]|nr:NAD+ synthase [Deltaproteobacteria bacterium]